jgi:hypothetical protein
LPEKNLTQHRGLEAVKASSLMRRAACRIVPLLIVLVAIGQWPLIRQTARAAERRGAIDAIAATPVAEMATEWSARRLIGATDVESRRADGVAAISGSPAHVALCVLLAAEPTASDPTSIEPASAHGRAPPR